MSWHLASLVLRRGLIAPSLRIIYYSQRLICVKVARGQIIVIIMGLVYFCNEFLEVKHRKSGLQVETLHGVAKPLFSVIFLKKGGA